MSDADESTDCHDISTAVRHCYGCTKVSTLEADLAQAWKKFDEERVRRVTLEARIAELERERDEARVIADAVVGFHHLARADRDEAVRLLREAPGSAIENDWERQRRAYLALHPAQPETPGKETT